MSDFQRRYLPSNAVLRSFESAARHQSFTQAAEELHLTQSAISRQVKELEEIIGTDLFRRVGRGVVLTPAGKSLSAGLAKDLENIRQTIMRAVSAGKVGSAIRVAALPGFASRFLIPRLPEFFEKHPNIEVSFSTRLKPFDMAEGQFDLAIHFGKDDWPDTDMKFLCSEKLVPVASRNFIDRHGIDDPADCANVPLLHLSTRPFAWQEYLENLGSTQSPALVGKYFDQFLMVAAAACASLGAGLIPSYLIEEELKTGALIAIDKNGIETANNYFLVTPLGQQNKHVQALCDWMLTCIDEHNPNHSYYA